jgi:hypothetical protein
MNDKQEPLFDENQTGTEKPTNGTGQTYIPCCGFCHSKYFHQFFNVTTNEVMNKVFFALTLAFYRKFKEIGPNKIDMYGPFWTYATMVFSLAVSQNIYSYMTKPEHTRFKYTIEYVPKAFMIVFVFGFFIPLFFNIIIRAFGGMIKYSKTISIYGYSQCINIFAMLLCGYPNDTYQNFLIIYGAVHSSLFLFLCLKDELRDSQGTLVYIAIGTLAACQLILVIIYKKYFFGNIYSADANYYEV